MEQQEGKLRSLTLQEKLELITIVEDGRSVKDVAEEYAVNRNTLHYILKHKDTIRKNLDARPGISNCKRIKKTKCPELEKRILDYMYESRERQEKLSGSSIKAMALELASELEVENFSASNGWLFSLFKRHQITISQFNKGIKSMGDSQNLSTCNSVNDSKLLEETIVTTPDTFVEAETTFHEAETTKPEYENFDFNTNTSCNDFFETEVVNEDDQEERLIEEDVQESDPVWRSWCRMCGEYDAAQRIDEEKIEIVQQLLNVSQSFKKFHLTFDTIFRLNSSLD